jgi:predicted flavoprotein YhiN
LCSDTRPDPLSIDAQTHKELQMKELPELIKLIKAWEVAINGTAITSFPL